MTIVNYRNMFLLNALIAIVYGVLFLLVPNELGDLNGFSFSVESDILARFFGVGIIGIGVLTLALSQAKDPNILRNVSIFLIIDHALGAFLILFGIYINAAFSSNIVFWSNLIPYIVLIVGFAYLLYTKAYEQSQ